MLLRYQLFWHYLNENSKDGQRVLSISKKTALSYSNMTLASVFAKTHQKFPEHSNHIIFIKDNLTGETFDKDGNKLLI